MSQVDCQQLIKAIKYLQDLDYDITDFMKRGVKEQFESKMSEEAEKLVDAVMDPEKNPSNGGPQMGQNKVDQDKTKKTPMEEIDAFEYKMTLKQEQHFKKLF